MYNPLLDTFIVVIQCGSFTKAAQQLYLTPASVMKKMNTLEDHLGLQLINRTKQGVTLTPEGSLIYKEALKLKKTSQHILDKAKKQQEIIRIGSSFLNPCQDFIYQWNQTSHQKNYQFQIIPYSDEKQNILDIVKSLDQEIDILIGAFNSPAMHKIACYEIIGDYHLCIALSPHHPLAHKDILDIKDLYDQDLMIPIQEDENDFSQFLKQHPRIQTKHTDYYYDLETFNTCEQNQSLLLTLDAWKNIHPSLITLPVKWDLKVPYGVLYTKNKKTEDFILEVRKTFNKGEKLC